MIKKSTLAKKLISYSALASVAMLSGQKVDAQVVYHKLPQPDTLRGSLDSVVHFALDLNNDGRMDFRISIGMLIRYLSSYSGSFTLASANLKGIKKSDQVFDHNYYPKYNLKSLFHLNSKTIIYKNRSYLTSDFSLWAPKGFMASIARYWYESWEPGKIAFAGVRIKNDSTSNYGWIRMQPLHDIFPLNYRIVIYDYAYQQSPDFPLLAGDTGFFKIQPVIRMVNSDSIYCGEDSIAIQVHNLPEGASLQWYLNDTLFESPTTDSMLILRQSGTYYAIVSLDRSSTSTNQITVKIPFQPDKPTINQNKDSLISSEAFSYQWYVDSKPITGFTTREILPAQSGFYQVMITASTGCSNISDSLEIVLTGIQNNNQQPALFVSNHLLHVEMLNPDFMYGGLVIYNELGQPVLSQAISSENFTIGLYAMPPGIYFVRLEKNGQHIMRKIFVE